MLKALFRLLGFLLVVAGFVVIVVDGTRSIAANRLVISFLDQTMQHFVPAAMPALQNEVAHLAGAGGWELARQALAFTPTALVPLLPGLLLLALGRRRPAGIGHPARL